MADPLTDAQEITTHEILDLTYATFWEVAQNNIGTTRLSTGINLAVAAMKTDINKFHNGQAPFLDVNNQPMWTEAIRNKAIYYIQQWDELDLDTTTIVTGSAQDVSGLTYDPAEKRKLIRFRFRNLFPFYNPASYLDKINGASETGGGSISVPVVN